MNPDEWAKMQAEANRAEAAGWRWATLVLGVAIIVIAGIVLVRDLIARRRALGDTDVWGRAQQELRQNFPKDCDGSFTCQAVEHAPNCYCDGYQPGAYR